MKMSEMFSLLEHFGSLPVKESVYLHPEDILFHNYDNVGALGKHVRILIVGTLVYEFLSQGKLSVSGWSWYRALHLGLKRPYVSIG